MKASSLSIAAALAVTAFGSSIASADPTPGQWVAVVTTVTTKAPFNTVGICIKADHSWYATSDRTGSGRWLMNGTKLLWRGDYSGGLHDAAVLDAPLTTAMSGPLMQWVTGTTDTTNTATENVFGASTWRFTSATCDRPR